MIALGICVSKSFKKLFTSEGRRKLKDEAFATSPSRSREDTSWGWRRRGSGHGMRVVKQAGYWAYHELIDNYRITQTYINRKIWEIVNKWINDSPSNDEPLWNNQTAINEASTPVRELPLCWRDVTRNHIKTQTNSQIKAHKMNEPSCKERFLLLPLPDLAAIFVGCPWWSSSLQTRLNDTVLFIAIWVASGIKCIVMLIGLMAIS